MRRGSLLALLPLSMVAVLLAVVVSPASAAGRGHGPPKKVTRAFMAYGAQHFDRDGDLTTDLREPGAVERLVAKAARGTDGVRPMSDADAQRLAVARGAEHGTSSAAQPDDITPEECRDRSELSGRPQGWIKNHFSYCQLSGVVAVEQRYRWRSAARSASSARGSRS